MEMKDKTSNEIIAVFLVGLIWGIGSFFIPIPPGDQLFMRVVGSFMVLLGVIQSFIEKKV